MSTGGDSQSVSDLELRDSLVVKANVSKSIVGESTTVLPSLLKLGRQIGRIGRVVVGSKCLTENDKVTLLNENEIFINTNATN